MATTTHLPDDLQVIDVDAHFTEPPDLWTSRVPASLRDRVPVQKVVDGSTAWYLDDAYWSSVGGNTIARGGKKRLGLQLIQPWDEVDPSSYEVGPRLALMDEAGIHAQIIYPNGIGFASNHIFAIDDLELRMVVLQAYNDFLVDMQTESGGRLLPQAMLPIWDMDRTVAEMARLLDAGITGFTLSDKPELLGLPELPEPFFDPMWDLFHQSRAVVNFHIASGSTREEMEDVRLRSDAAATPRPQGPGRPIPARLPLAWEAHTPQRGLVALGAQAATSNMRIIANLLMSDLFDRFDRLKVVSVESGLGWMPFMLETIEYMFDELVTDPAERQRSKGRPTDYFREHLSVSFWYETIGPKKLIEDVGVKNVLVETDVPHPTCLYPDPLSHFRRIMADLDPWIVRRVLQDNAAELYGIPVGA